MVKKQELLQIIKFIIDYLIFLCTQRRFFGICVGCGVFLLDISNKKMYNINRVGDNIASIEEYDTANGNTLVGTMYYIFDSDGKQFRKKHIDADGSLPCDSTTE